MRHLMGGVSRVIVLVILSALPAQAEWVTIHISGIVDSAGGYGYNPGGKINAGDTITGWYKYDTAMPDLDPSNTYGLYRYYSAPAGVSLQLNNFMFETDFENVNFRMSLINDEQNTNSDSYSFFSYNNTSLMDGGSVTSISWGLFDQTGTAIYNDALPNSPPCLNQWQSNLLEIRINEKYIIEAHITSAIPEPGTLIILGLGTLGIFTRKSSRN